jgi:hypothetical protein
VSSGAHKGSIGLLPWPSANGRSEVLPRPRSSSSSKIMSERPSGGMTRLIVRGKKTSVVEEEPRRRR